MQLPIRMFRIVLSLLFAGLLLSGCASTSVPFKADFIGSIHMNPNIKGDPSPTVVYIYELASPTTFESGNYFSLTDPDSGVLADDLLGYNEVMLFPGKELSLEQKLHLSTRYIGFVAAFRDINTAQWRTVVPVKAGSSNKFMVRISKDAIEVSKKTMDLSFEKADEIKKKIKPDEELKFDF
ncbi:type VI secretion system lipoprotein TssJ [Vibrio sp. JC009]|uniref:type VI secretion system lipoprotein TssJ n=1 Tax=Vibrio sp. JC009 TaxID=2912314 RepID=UPI0023AF39E8|nr:type VI secretion system lipoprotein TssJ [Vibrio sp. JC009]WED22941.1 type VI secretion system lipoprotein TssJ [Vibrio sp. JC009]